MNITSVFRCNVVAKSRVVKIYFPQLFLLHEVQQDWLQHLLHLWLLMMVLSLAMGSLFICIQLHWPSLWDHTDRGINQNVILAILPCLSALGSSVSTTLAFLAAGARTSSAARIMLGLVSSQWGNNFV